MPRARSNPYLTKRSTVVRLGGPDPAAGPQTGDGRPRIRGAHTPPTPQGESLSSTEGYTPIPKGASSSIGARRSDAPLVQSYSQGSQDLAFTIAGSEPRLLSAQIDLQHQMYSQTSRKPREARLALWNKLLLHAGVPEPFQLTPESIQLGASVLRSSGYRSTMAYVDIAVQEFVRRGGTKSQLLELTIRDTRRACTRGLGSPKQSGAFPMERIPELCNTQVSWAANGPMWPSRTLLCGCWWLTREIELSNAVVGDITRPDPDSIRWNLPASKSDPQALGMARTHKCACGLLSGGTPSVDHSMCPACNLWSQTKASREFSDHIAAHPVYFSNDLTSGDSFPLFPTKSGTFPTKSDMVRTIESAARQLHIDTVSEGKPVWGGHSLRRGGAQYLARCGVDVWRIQALARHSGSAILLYLDGVHAESLGNIAAEASLGRDLTNVREELSALRAQLDRHRCEVDVKFMETLPQGNSSIVIPIKVSEIIPDVVVPTVPGTSELTSCQNNPFVISSRRGGRRHQRNPATIGRAWCGWEWSLQRGAILVADDTTGLGCTKCVRQAAAARAAKTAGAAAAAAGAAGADATSSSSSPSPSSASGGE
jgi:hypothetical protein